jgi:hypothetical protein
MGASEKNQQTWMKYNCMKIVCRLMETQFNISRTMVRHFNSFFFLFLIFKNTKTNQNNINVIYVNQVKVNLDAENASNNV